MEEEKNLNIVLVGMMGTGKSYIGNKLAKLLAQFSYVDTDEEIEKSTGLTINEIFERHGEKHFRELETKLIKEISKKYNQIISIGGGAFESAENRANLQKNGLTFYLKNPPKEIFERIKDETHRPLLNEDFSVENIEKMLRQREKNYFKTNFLINAFQKPAYKLLDDILREYHEYVKKRNFS